VPSAPSTGPALPFVGAGLVLMDDDDRTYARLESAGLLAQGQVRHYVNWEMRQDGRVTLAGNALLMPLDGKPTYLKLERKGDQLRASAGAEWTTWNGMKPLDVKLPARLRLGVSLSTTSAARFDPRFDNFRLDGGKLKPPAEATAKKLSPPAEADLAREV